MSFRDWYVEMQTLSWTVSSCPVQLTDAFDKCVDFFPTAQDRIVL